MSILRCAIFVLVLCGVAVAEPVRVSAAISMKESLEQAAQTYKTGGGGDVEFVFGSSGELMTQIKNGAPIDLFISAAAKQVDELTQAGKVDGATRKTIAGNRLVLIVPASAKSPPTGFDQLAGVKRLSIGEPKTVPAGQYAMKALTALKLDTTLGDRLIFGSNVRQVLNYVERNEVTAGIVYATDAKQSGDKVKVVATADASLHEPILYPAVVISASRNKAEAGRFLGFLADEKGQKILQEHGFVPAKDLVQKS